MTNLPEQKDQINIKFKSHAHTLMFDEEISEIKLGDSEWQRIGEAIDMSDTKILKQNARTQLIGAGACLIATAALVLGCVAVLDQREILLREPPENHSQEIKQLESTNRIYSLKLSNEGWHWVDGAWESRK